MKPILFNTEMVRAILEGRKTVTRRVIKKEKVADVLSSPARLSLPEVTDAQFIQCLCDAPYDKGDILYVRETWGIYCRHWYEADHFEYRASFKTEQTEYGLTEPPKWRPSIHMPKEAARIFLRVVSIRAERLQDMLELDAINEGCAGIPYLEDGIKSGWIEPPALEFSLLWDTTINPADMPCYGWEANPWVWVIEFERCEKPEE